MRAEHIKYFVALAENHSITKTSQDFFTTHQSVSKAIRQLEDEMEAQLFTRSAKGMMLTPEGELFLPVARDTIDKFHTLRLQFAHMARQRDMEGTLNFWGSPVANAVTTQALIKDFNTLYPKVRYNVSEANPSDIMHYVSLHHAALGVVAIMHNDDYRTVYKPYIDQVHLDLLMQDEYMCVVGPRSPLADCKKVPIAEFIKQPLVMLQTGQQKDDHPFTQLLRRMGNIEPSLTTPSYQLYSNSIIQGQYIGITSRRFSALSPMTAENEIIRIPFEEDMTLDIMLATNAQPQWDEISEAFVSLAREGAEI